MKTILFTVATVFTLLASASNHTVVGSNYFPGYGNVPSNLVCIAADSVKASVPAKSVTTCTKYKASLDGSTCVAYKTTNTPARELVAALSFDQKTCLESRTEFTTSLLPKEVCTKYGTKTYNQPRSYKLATSVQTDVFHNDIEFTTVAIPACQ